MTDVVNKNGPLTTMVDGPDEGWLTGLEPATPRSTIKGQSNASQATQELAKTTAPVCTRVCTIEAKSAKNAGAIDPDLARLIANWSKLPDQVRHCIVALVNDATVGQQ